MTLGVGTAVVAGAVTWAVHNARSGATSRDSGTSDEPQPSAIPPTSAAPVVPTPPLPAPAPALEPVDGVTAPEEPAHAAAPAGAAPTAQVATTRYVVRSGDTLWAIARRNGTTPAAIAAASGIAANSVIRPGQVLQVPGSGGAPEPTRPAPAPAPAPASSPSRPDRAPAPGAHGRVAITFDDGPNGATTDAILGTLERLHANATFFVVGNRVAANGARLVRMRDAGHEVANHSWDHSQMTRLSSADVRSQMRRTSDAIETAAGRRPITFRPPYGAHNASVDAAAAAEGMHVAMWTSDTNDWRRPGTDAIVAEALRGAHDGSIILMHDGGGNRSQTVAAVERVVNGLRARGLEPVTVSQLRSSS